MIPTNDLLPSDSSVSVNSTCSSQCTVTISSAINVSANTVTCLTHDSVNVTNVEARGTCGGPCCSDNSEPYQPTNKDFVTRLTLRQYSEGNRSFNPEWFATHKWLTLCANIGKAFCATCCNELRKNKSLNLSKFKEPAFTKGGWNGWKKSETSLIKHRNSDGHKEAELKSLIVEQKCPAVNVQLDNSLVKVQSDRRQMLLKELSTIRCLLRQGLAFRGQTETEGNLQQFLKLRSDDVPKLEWWLQQGKYLSQEIQNELIQLFGNSVLRLILVDIQQAEFFFSSCR